MADNSEARIILIFAIDKSSPPGKDNDDINNDIVNPIPPSKLAPYICFRVTLDGSLAILKCINR